MPDRRSGLDMVACSLAGTDFVDYLTTFDFGPDNELADTFGINKRYESEIVVASGDSFTAELNVEQSGTVKSNLDVSLWTIGGVALLGDLKDGSISIDNSAKEGKGIADLKAFPHLLRTRMTIEGEYEINLSSGVVRPDLVKLASSSTIADKNVAYSLSTGGIVLQGNGVIQRARHTASQEELQRYSATIKSKGTPTAASGHSLIVSALTGTGSIAFSVNTGVGTWAGTAVIESAEIRVRESAVLSAVFGFTVFGQPTYTPPA